MPVFKKGDRKFPSNYSVRHHKLPKTTHSEFSSITLVQRNIKPPNLEQVFCTDCFHIVAICTQKFKFVLLLEHQVYALLENYVLKIFESLGVSANYLLKLKLPIVETKISTVKHLQIYP